MGKDTKIAWATNSWNPWWGCYQIQGRRACQNCYAKAFTKRLGLDVFGKDKARKLFGGRHWREPLAWDAAAAKAGRRDSVFLMSMGDFFDPHPDLRAPRAQAFHLIEQTPHLVWLVLTKRIRNVTPMFRANNVFAWPRNMWLGLTVGTQEDAEEDMYLLNDIKASNVGCHTFVSAEPMLTEINLRPWLSGHLFGPDWVICGAESAPGKRLGRPLEVDWVRDLRDQCKTSDVPFMYKQGPVDGKLVELPELDGVVWNQKPVWLEG